MTRTHDLFPDTWSVACRVSLRGIILHWANHSPCQDLSAPYRSIAATLTFVLTGSITATIIHGASASPLGPLDWSLGDFASTFAIAQASLFLTSLYLYKAVSVSDVRYDGMRLKRRHRHQNLKQILVVTLKIYRLTGVLLRF